jgi:hypothetical protein
LELKNFDYKEKQKIIVKKEYSEKLIYKSRINNLDEQNFKLFNSYEKPQKISNIIQTGKFTHNQDDNSIFEITHHNNDSEIKVLFIDSENKKITQTNSMKSMYYVELGIFDSKDQSDKILQEIYDFNRKSLSEINTIFENVIYKDKAFIKLIIPSINSFSEARQICRYIQEFHNHCLIKTYKN